MKRLVVYIVNIDEDPAEKAFDRTVKLINEISLVDIDLKSVYVEPHDDYRGIVARFDYSFIDKTAHESRNASKAFQDAFKSLVEAQLWNVTNVKVTLQTVGVSN